MALNTIFLPLTVVTMLFFSLCRSACGQAKEGAGCNEALLKSEFSLQQAPETACSAERKKFIQQVVDEMKEDYGGTMVTEEFPHPHLDTPEFVASFLREFSKPPAELSKYDYRFDRLLSRVAGEPKALEDSRLDWDMWRAFLLYENTGLSGDYYKHAKTGDMEIFQSARELLWLYLSHNAAAILADHPRRAWWIHQLTRDLEAPGGRPLRRWYLLNLVTASDPERKALEKIPMPEKFLPWEPGLPKEPKIRLRQPHPLDPFLLLADKEANMQPAHVTVMRGPRGFWVSALGES